MSPRRRHRSESNTVGLGMVIGVTAGAAILLLAFFANMVSPGLFVRPSPTPTVTQRVLPTSTQAPPTSTPTFTPIPTFALSTNLPSGYDIEVTYTPDPLGLRILEGDLEFAGPLSPAQQVALFRASVSYEQASVEDSLKAAKEINGVGYGDPTNICGPLAIAILRDAGIIDADIDPHDYWLLDPTKVIDQRLLAAAFPPDRFAHRAFSTQLNKVDWNAAPLYPGDFLFIWHGSWGNFDHMLVVNRVDSEGRAYSVTNFGTPDGYMIAETMLYDPADPQAGIFHTWTKQRDQILGSTGFGGFELWRARAQ